MTRQSFEWKLPDRNLALGGRTLLMAIVNVTPDSFSDGGRFLDKDSAVEHGRLAAEAGADILDIGGASSRPGAALVDPAEEFRRVVPVVRELAKLDIAVSVDTWRSEVAERAMDAGATIINDISALRFDKNMTKLARDRRPGVVLMHSTGRAGELHHPTGRITVEDVVEGLRQAAMEAESAGVDHNSIVLDPGLGFGKSRRTNLELIRDTFKLGELGFPLLLGPSRKLYPKTEGPGTDGAMWATASAVALAAAFGVHVVRVHDVRQMRTVVDFADEICCSSAPVD